MPCSYCKCTTHNRQRCDTFKQDIDRETPIIMARLEQEGTTITRDLAVKLARKTLLERRPIFYDTVPIEAISWS